MGRAWRVVGFGDPRAALRMEPVSWPPPPPGRLLVRVRAAGVGASDQLMLRGEFPGLATPPFGIGEEVAGEVVATASSSRMRVGDRVMGVTPFAEGDGGYGEYAYVREELTAKVPDALDDWQAAGFMIGFRITYAALVERCPVEPGQTLLVLDAATGLGLAAVQLGAALGATVVAVTGDDAELGLCRRFGAATGINHRRSDLVSAVDDLTGGRGADVVYDTVGGPLAETAARTLARHGRIALVGRSSGRAARLDPRDLLLGNLSVIGVFVGDASQAEDAGAWAELVRLAADHRIVTPVGAVHDFDELPDVLAHWSINRPGKAVVHIGSPVDDPGTDEGP